jgi:hypothetical protein
MYNQIIKKFSIFVFESELLLLLWHSIGEQSQAEAELSERGLAWAHAN